VVFGEGGGFGLAEDATEDKALNPTEFIYFEEIGKEDVSATTDGKAKRQLEEDLDKGIKLVGRESKDRLGYLSDCPSEERGEKDLGYRHHDELVLPK
jgi:hypothetical protein